MRTSDSVVPPAHLTLDRVITHWARCQGQAPALEYDDGSVVLTFAQLEERICALATSLSQAVKPGAVVAVVCDDSPEFHVLLNALWRCQASVLLINRQWGDAVVNDLLCLTGAACVFASEPTTDVSYSALVRPFPPPASHASWTSSNGDLDAVAIYATTSGTTDDPKCVPITHRQIRAAYRTCLEVLDFGSVRRAASLFPINGIGVLGVCFLLPREIGAATRVFPPFAMTNVQRSWQGVIGGDVDFVYVVPPLVRLLNALPPMRPSDKQVLVLCAAAPVREYELRTLERKFPVRAFNAYGLTEMTFAVFFGCRDFGDVASESIGYPVGIDAKIVGEDGEVVDGPTSGELYLRGPMLTAGYLHNPAATANIWVDGWLRTGDLAERDAQGRYYIRGRLKDVVVRGGVLCYFHELEHYARRAPGVIDACAFKGRDLPSGDELCLVVQINAPTEAGDLMRWIRDEIGAEKVPNVLAVWAKELPRNSNGKVLRNVLARLHRVGHLVPSLAEPGRGSSHATDNVASTF